jgi:hypothetical protein
VERTKLLYRPPQTGKLQGGSRKEPPLHMDRTKAKGQ